jgi:hypothetical protein
MPPHFDPKIFPNHVILRDLNANPPIEKMNCLKCGGLADALWKNGVLPARLRAALIPPFSPIKTPFPEEARKIAHCRDYGIV